MLFDEFKELAVPVAITVAPKALERDQERKSARGESGGTGETNTGLSGGTDARDALDTVVQSINMMLA